MTAAWADRRGRLPFLVAIVVLASILGALRGDASADVVATASKAKAVDIRGFAFHPATLTIGRGTKVVFTNSSAVTHTATRGGSFDTGRIKPGKSVPVRFSQKGSFAYHCKIHPSMRGKIVVN